MITKNLHERMKLIRDELSLHSNKKIIRQIFEIMKSELMSDLLESFIDESENSSIFSEIVIDGLYEIEDDYGIER